jgi:hypothetical protein
MDNDKYPPRTPEAHKPEDPVEELSKSVKSDVGALLKGLCDARCCGKPSGDFDRHDLLPCCSSCDDIFNLEKYGVEALAYKRPVGCYCTKPPHGYSTECC